MDHMSERATTYEEALHLVEAYRLFAIPSLFVVGPHTFELDSRGNPEWHSLQQVRLEDFAQASNGATEIDIGERYRIEEPFDIEFNHCGFVVWAAASVQIAHPLTHFSQGPKLVAPRAGVTQYGAATEPTTVEEMHHGQFQAPTDGLQSAMDAGAPIVGLLEATQFPIRSHGWRPAEIDIRFPPVTICVW